MLYFANPSTEAVREAMRRGLLGCIRTPGQGNRHIPEAIWCADNGCFGKNYVGDDAWFAWLKRNSVHVPTCLFATAPDVVGDAEATLARSLPWLPKIRSLGYPAALVAQDGLEHLEVPWNEFDVLFIGGGTEWKLGPAVVELVAQARARGKPVHAGRVNSLKRYRQFQELGCTSADGTFIAFGPDKNLPQVLYWQGHPSTYAPKRGGHKMPPPVPALNRLLITGSRDWRDEDRLVRELEWWVGFLDIDVLVHGHCPLGADALADKWARVHMARAPERWPAYWKQLGPAAGPYRNQQMVDAGAEVCLAFPMNHSKGTWDCVRKAQAAGIPTLIHEGGDLHPGLRSKEGP